MSFCALTARGSGSVRRGTKPKIHLSATTARGGTATDREAASAPEYATMGKAKPFIDKKTATTFQLVCAEVPDGDDEAGQAEDRAFARVQASSYIFGVFVSRSTVCCLHSFRKFSILYNNSGNL